MRACIAICMTVRANSLSASPRPIRYPADGCKYSRDACPAPAKSDPPGTRFLAPTALVCDGCTEVVFPAFPRLRAVVRGPTPDGQDGCDVCRYTAGPVSSRVASVGGAGRIVSSGSLGDRLVELIEPPDDVLSILCC